EFELSDLKAEVTRVESVQSYFEWKSAIPQLLLQPFRPVARAAQSQRGDGQSVTGRGGEKRETPLGWTWQPRQRTAKPVSAAGVARAAGPETALASAAAAAPSTATTAVETVVARLEHSSPEAHRHIIKEMQMMP
ncbi:unnamed protein product, partial [Ascophyllum nodosum]